MADTPTWMILTQWASRVILLLLAGLSVWSVSIMLDRFRVFKQIEDNPSLKKARELISASNWAALAELTRTPAPEDLALGTLHAAVSAPHDSVDRAVRGYLSLEKARLEQGLTTLATLGANAPFIGLFGTVLGIIQAFGTLGKSAGTSSVMTGISEALIATAIGLFVAIPAVVAYNVFSRKLKLVVVECEALRDQYLARAPHGR